MKGIKTSLKGLSVRASTKGMFMVASSYYLTFQLFLGFWAVIFILGAPIAMVISEGAGYTTAGIGMAIALVNGGFGLCICLVCVLIFSIQGVKSVFGGTRQMLKFIMFTIAIIGYLTPFLQLLPFVFGWLFVVAHNPD